MGLHIKDIKGHKKCSHWQLEFVPDKLYNYDYIIFTYMAVIC